MAWAPASSLSLFSTVFGDRGARIERDVAYGDHPRLRLDVYRPAEGVREHDAGHSVSLRRVVEQRRQGDL
jgi:hypothetical protein